MTLFLVCNDKGGVGKSTIAPELAVYLYDLERSVAVVDADKSLATAKHIHGAEQGIPVGALLDAKSINRTVPKLIKNHEYIVADAPANLGDETFALMKLADVVIIPTVPSIKVFEGTVTTWEFVEDARNRIGKPTHAYVVFNMVKGNRQKKFEKYREDAVARGLPVTKAFVRERAALADVEELGTTISRMKVSQATRDAQSDLTAVFAEVFQSMHAKRVANE